MTGEVFAIKEGIKLVSSHFHGSVFVEVTREMLFIGLVARERVIGELLFIYF